MDFDGLGGEAAERECSAGKAISRTPMIAADERIHIQNWFICVLAILRCYVRGVGEKGKKEQCKEKMGGGP